jgi:hypothetical protein
MAELNLDEIERDAREGDGVAWTLRPAGETVKGREVGPWFVDTEDGESVGLFYRRDDALRAVATREEILALIAEVRRLRASSAPSAPEPVAPVAPALSVAATDPDAINPFLAARAATRARKRALTQTSENDEE